MSKGYAGSRRNVSCEMKKAQTGGIGDKRKCVDLADLQEQTVTERMY